MGTHVCGWRLLSQPHVVKDKSLAVFQPAVSRAHSSGLAGPLGRTVAGGVAPALPHISFLPRVTYIMDLSLSLPPAEEFLQRPGTSRRFRWLFPAFLGECGDPCVSFDIPHLMYLNLLFLKLRAVISQVIPLLSLNFFCQEEHR